MKAAHPMTVGLPRICRTCQSPFRRMGLVKLAAMLALRVSLAFLPAGPMIAQAAEVPTKPITPEDVNKAMSLIIGRLKGENDSLMQELGNAYAELSATQRALLESQAHPKAEACQPATPK